MPMPDLLNKYGLTKSDVAKGAELQGEGLKSRVAKYKAELKEKTKKRDEIKKKYVKVANDYARDYHPGKLVVYIRNGMGSATGGGHSGSDKYYVAMPGFYVTSSTWFYHDTNPPSHATEINGNLKLLAHEIGHYLGLAHTFSGIEYDDIGESEDQIVAQFISKNGEANPELLDGDRGRRFVPHRRHEERRWVDWL